MRPLHGSLVAVLGLWGPPRSVLGSQGSMADILVSTPTQVSRTDGGPEDLPSLQEARISIPKEGPQAQGS